MRIQRQNKEHEYLRNQLSNVQYSRTYLLANFRECPIIHERQKNTTYWELYSTVRMLNIEVTKSTCLCITRRILFEECKAINTSGVYIFSCTLPYVVWVNNVKLFGVLMDCTLNFDEHIKQIAKKCNNRLCCNLQQ